jgi:ABC-2 type transport system ATP-binding protein
MDFTGLKPLADKPMRGLSKGMKQRLCLGRALVHDPAVLILDEPAAGLDPRARIELRRIIGSLAAEGKTLLISSHILTELAEMCDSVAILECGRLLATGSVDEIRRRLRPSRDLFVRFRGAGTTVVELLQKLPFVQQVRNEPLGISFTIDGGDDEQVSIARYLIEHQVEVLEYTPREKSLEDVFLQVTEGRVQ